MFSSVHLIKIKLLLEPTFKKKEKKNISFTMQLTCAIIMQPIIIIKVRVLKIIENKLLLLLLLLLLLIGRKVLLFGRASA